MANRPILIAVDSAAQIWTPGDRAADPDGRVLALLSEIAGVMSARPLFGVFGGDGSAGNRVDNAIANFDAGGYGTQLNNWTLQAAANVTLNNQWGVHKIAVAGTLQMLAGAQVTAINGPGIGGPAAGVNQHGNQGYPRSHAPYIGGVGGGGGGNAAGGGPWNGAASGYVNQYLAAGGPGNAVGNGTNGGGGFLSPYKSGGWYDELWSFLGGSGGGSGGGSAGGASGAGGRGGAVTLIEAVNLDMQGGSLWCGGYPGGNGATGGIGASGGGGGGGGGVIIIRYRNLINPFATGVTVTGGAGGIGGTAVGLQKAGDGGAGGVGFFGLVNVP